MPATRRRDSLERVKTPEAPELQTEQTVESAPEQAPVQEQAVPEVVPPISAMQIAPAPELPELLVEIETDLSKGLEDVYAALPESVKPAFRARGEEIAKEIVIMVESGKFAMKKVIDLIRSWLKMIPGVNRFFVEQEAKIRADKIANRRENGGI
ncbi:MAG: hypothetical protein O3B64_04025 [bacterium]|nr:hypothetical protein [bacterium]